MNLNFNNLIVSWTPSGLNQKLNTYVIEIIISDILNVYTQATIIKECLNNFFLKLDMRLENKTNNWIDDSYRLSSNEKIIGLITFDLFLYSLYIEFDNEVDYLDLKIKMNNLNL